MHNTPQPYNQPPFGQLPPGYFFRYDILPLPKPEPAPMQSQEEIITLINCVTSVNNINGNIAEVGVYEGGTAKLIAEYKSINKILFLCDTFAGLVDCTSDNDWHANGNFICNEASVIDRFKSINDVKIVKGYFPESATTEMQSNKYSFVHIDVDTYQSTLNCLELFYPKITKQGIVLIHDYDNAASCPGVKKAVDSFLANKQEKLILHGTSQGSFIKL